MVFMTIGKGIQAKWFRVNHLKGFGVVITDGKVL
jgi:hypothetical protein